MSGKKRKLGCEVGGDPSKKIARQQGFLPSYSADYKFLRQSKRGQQYAHCSYCLCDFSVAHAGRNDIERHVKSAKHKASEKAIGFTGSLKAFMPSSSQGQLQNTFERDVTRAEATMAQLIAEMNLPLSAADTFTKAVKVMFPDSKIAQKYQSGRSKTTSIIKELGNQAQSELASRMKSGPFTLSTDGSNDDKAKQFPMVVRTIDPNDGRVTSELLSVPVCTGSATGKT